MVYALFYFLSSAYPMESVYSNTGVHISSLVDSELVLLQDSSIASSWGNYGLALLVIGDCKTKWALDISVSIDSCPEGLRGLATLAVQDGDYRNALELLSSCPQDYLVQVMTCSILQNQGFLEKSDSLLNCIDPLGSHCGASDYLFVRQNQLEGNFAKADSITNRLYAESDTVFRDIMYLSQLIMQYPDSAFDNERIVKSLRYDMLFTGGVFYNELISVLSTETASLEDNYLLCRVLCISGRWEEAYTIFSTIPVMEMGHEAIVLYINVTLNNYNLSKAEEVIDDALLLYPQSPDIWSLYGHLLLESGKNREAYHMMTDAVAITGSSECIALCGLAAELSGNVELAISAYSPLLAMSADSIVLINRTRESILDTFQEQPYPSLMGQDIGFSMGKRFSGVLSLALLKSTGGFGQNNVSVSGNVNYAYGLYGSRITGSTQYSNISWPGSPERYIYSGVSIEANNYSSKNYFQKIDFSWNHWLNSIRRWDYECSIACGYSFYPSQQIKIYPFIVSFWDG